MSVQPELDFAGHRSATGSELKELGMSRVVENEHEAWKSSALEVVERLAKLSPRITSDEMRTAIASELGEPHHCNVWGAIPRMAAAEGLIVSTDDYLPSKITSRHAGMNRIWRSLFFSVDSKT